MLAAHDPRMEFVPRQRVPGQHQPLTVLLVEDDRADALQVEELIADAGRRDPHGVGGVDG